MRAVLIVFAAVALIACKSKEGTTEVVGKDPKWRTDTVVVSFERAACFGKCPTFKADFYGDGTVRYHGINFVDNEGHYVGKVTDTQLEQVYDAALDVGFFQMEKKYDGPITDVPSQIYYIEMHGDRQRVMARYQAPAELKALGIHLDELLDGISWQAEPQKDH